MANASQGPDGRFRPRYGPDEARQCPRCERHLPADEFYAKTRAEDGSVRTRGTYCKECCRRMQRKENGYKSRRKRTPEDTRRISAAYYRKLKQDPERYAKYQAKRRELDRKRRERAKTDPELAEALRRSSAKWRSKPETKAMQRIDDRIRRRDDGDPRSTYSDAIEAFIDCADYVPAAPFVEWLGSTFAEPPPEFELLVGHNLNRYLDQGLISLGVVDRVVTYGLGRPDLVESLYPYDTYRAGFSHHEWRRRFANA